jgi:antitoxin (DNA-binding transcriptional repressor) of toxin-antitoxin stability system
MDAVWHGRIVARLVPVAPTAQGTPPWLRLRGSGKLRMQPEESLLNAVDFEAFSGADK